MIDSPVIAKRQKMYYYVCINSMRQTGEVGLPIQASRPFYTMRKMLLSDCSIMRGPAYEF